MLFSTMLRVPARLLTPRFALLPLGEKSPHGVGQRLRSHIDAFIDTYHKHANLLVWPQAEVYWHRVKGCRISQL
jgi:hypothetical protein